MLETERQTRRLVIKHRDELIQLAMVWYDMTNPHSAEEWRDCDVDYRREYTIAVATNIVFGAIPNFIHDHPIYHRIIHPEMSK